MRPAHWHVDLVGAPNPERFVLPGRTNESDVRTLLRLVVARDLTPREIIEAAQSPTGGLLAVRPTNDGLACGDATTCVYARRCTINHDVT